jgi:hypothetical protein
MLLLLPLDLFVEMFMDTLTRLFRKLFFIPLGIVDERLTRVVQVPLFDQAFVCFVQLYCISSFVWRTKRTMPYIPKYYAFILCGESVGLGKRSDRDQNSIDTEPHTSALREALQDSN